MTCENARNHGEWVLSHPQVERAAAARSNCGKPHRPTATNERSSDHHNQHRGHDADHGDDGDDGDGLDEYNLASGVHGGADGSVHASPLPENDDQGADVRGNDNSGRGNGVAKGERLRTRSAIVRPSVASYRDVAVREDVRVPPHDGRRGSHSRTNLEGTPKACGE